MSFRRWLLVVLVVLAGCKGKAPPPAAAAPLPVVTEESTDLLLTWIDDKGEFHVEQKVASVPPSARDVVRVADPVKDPPQLDDVFVADLRNVGPDGHYAVRTMSRPAFEKLAVERRKANGAVLAERGAPAAGSEAAGAASAEPGAPGVDRPTVIIYGASWCGPCHQTMAYLKKRGVSFVEKDIEEDSGAAREMQAKLATAGKRGGSIPVIDIRGKILVGFDQHAVDAALAAL